MQNQFMRKLTMAVLAVFLFVATANAQKDGGGHDYRTALGVKVWDGGGISLKHFFNERGAGELIAFFWNRGFRLTGLYEIHGDIPGASGLKWYIGPGAHVGFYDYTRGNNKVDGTFIGIDGVLGLDYKFNGAPINISLDWQPSFEFGDYVGFNGNWGGLGIRYTF
jgi:hypothetical protein